MPPLAPNIWEIAWHNIGLAMNAFSNRTKFSEKCNEDIAALGLTMDAMQSKLGEMRIKNGVGSTDPSSSLFPYNSAAAAAEAGYFVGAWFTPNTVTIRTGTGNLVTAVTQLGGNTMYVDPRLISQFVEQNEGLLMHEMLHSFGRSDNDIGRILSLLDPNIKPDANGNYTNSQQFTNKFATDCFTGKDNRN
jgi:hypothetical protein